MKAFATILVLLAFAAAPALAGEVHHHKATHKLAQAPSASYGTGNVVPFRFNSQGQAVPIQPQPLPASR
jgi:hypothetical protein